MKDFTTIFNTYLSGSCSTTIACILSQPFDVIKTNYLIYPDSVSYRGTSHFIYQKYGPLGFFRGIQPSIIRSLLGGGSWFTLLEYFQSKMNQTSNQGMQFLRNGQLAMAARSINIALVSPITVIKVRLEGAFTDHQYSGVRDALRRIYLEEGFKGYYRGLSANILRDAPQAGLSYAFYTHYQKLLESVIINPHQLNFLAGSCAACSAVLITQPFDILKIRLQYAHLNKSEQLKYKSLLQGLISIFKTEGIQGYTKGLGIRIFERSFSYGLLWGVYSFIKDLMHIKE